MKVLSKEDVCFVLEPVAKFLLAAGVSRDDAREAVLLSARRSLRLAAQDAGLPLSAATEHAEAVAMALVPDRN